MASSIAANNNYSDIATSFLQHPITQELGAVVDANAIKQSVRNLVNTNFYERRFQPEIGCGIRGLLFENVTPVVQEALEDAIRTTITNFEPRVRLLAVKAKPSPDEHEYNVSIIFSLLNSKQPIEISVILERVR